MFYVLAPECRDIYSVGGIGTCHLQCACMINGSRELHHSYYIREAKNIISQKNNDNDLEMACHTPPLKSKETRGTAITQLQSHPFINVEFMDGYLGPRLGNDTSPCFLAFMRGGV